MKYLLVGFLSYLLLGTLGCGGRTTYVVYPVQPAAQPTSQPSPIPSTQPTPQVSPSPTAHMDNSAGLTLAEDQLEMVPDSDYLTLSAVDKLPSLEQFKLIQELKIVSRKLDAYSFNEADIYLDPYDEPYGEDDERLPEYFQVALPKPILEKAGGQVRVSLPGQEIVSQLSFLLKTAEDRGDSYDHVKVRILLTDTRKQGNPVQVIFIATLWEASQ